MSLTLPERLKIETRALHAAAERSAFMALLLAGRMERPAYCALLRNLHAIYAELEPAIVRHAAHPMIAPVYSKALFRSTALESDLMALHGPGWASDIGLRPAAVDYVARLREIDATQPGLLLAHAYVRYLGDLNGGRMLRRIVAQSAALAGERGVAFYDFGDAVAVRNQADAFRAGMASVTAEATQSNALVDEAKLAFGLHQRLFDELTIEAGLTESRRVR